MNAIVRIVLALVFIVVPLTSFNLKPVEAGAESIPSVEWYNPPTAVYGSREIEMGIYFKNPTSSSLKVDASVWYNGAAINTNYGPSWQMSPYSLALDGPSVCDPTGCRAKVNGVIPAYGRIYLITRVFSGTKLGTMTIGSVETQFGKWEDNSGPKIIAQTYTEGKITLTEGIGPLKVQMNALYQTDSGGYKAFEVQATDRYLNYFRLQGVGVDCVDSTVMEWSNRQPMFWDTTYASFYVGVYIPNIPGLVCTITALVTTRDTTLAVSQTIRQ